eukprot:6664606-Pyramimonas_sp.AAC.1
MALHFAVPPFAAWPSLSTSRSPRGLLPLGLLSLSRDYLTLPPSAVSAPTPPRSAPRLSFLLRLLVVSRNQSTPSWSGSRWPPSNRLPCMVRGVLQL